jgi:3',5'-cyclic AMP phosphodiesterase CpdA
MTHPTAPSEPSLPNKIVSAGGWKLWSQQEHAEPDTIRSGASFLVFFSGFVGFLPTLALFHASNQHWNLRDDLPTSLGHWLIVPFPVLATLGGLLLLFSQTPDGLKQLPGRLALILLGSSPSRRLHLILRGAILIVAAFIIVGVLTVLIFGGSFAASNSWAVKYQARLGANPGPLESSFLVAVGAVLFSLNGLMWVLLFGAIKVIGPTLRMKSYPRPKVEEIPKEFGSLTDADFVVAHISDCHLTRNASTKTTEGHPGGMGAMAKLFAAREGELSRCDAILLTGDAVDSGHAREWWQFFQLITLHRLHNRLFLVPGNHELSIPSPYAHQRLRAFGPGDEFQVFRRLRFMGALYDTRSASAFSLDSQGAERSLKSILDANMELLKSAATTVDEDMRRLNAGEYGRPRHGMTGPPQRFYKIQEEVMALWEMLFPYWQVLGDRLLLIVIDSNARATNLATNGFGEISEAQLERLRILGSKFADHLPIIAMHHHPTDPPGWSALSGIRSLHSFLSLTNAGRFFEILAGGFRTPPVILNGHRHLDVAFRVSVGHEIRRSTMSFQVFASPSSSFGRDAQGPGFYGVGFGHRDPDPRLVCRVWHGA